MECSVLPYEPRSVPHDVFHHVQYRPEPDGSTTLVLHVKDHIRVIVMGRSGRQMTDTGLPIRNFVGDGLIPAGELDRKRQPPNTVLRGPHRQNTPTSDRAVTDKGVQTAISFGRRLRQTVGFVDIAMVHSYDPDEPPTTVKPVPVPTPRDQSSTTFIPQPMSSSLHLLGEEHCAQCTTIIQTGYPLALCPRHGSVSTLPVTDPPVAKHGRPTTLIIADQMNKLDGGTYPKPQPIQTTVRNSTNQRVRVTCPYRLKRFPFSRRKPIREFQFSLPEDGNAHRLRTNVRRSQQYREAHRLEPPPFARSRAVSDLTPFEVSFPPGNRNPCFNSSVPDGAAAQRTPIPGDSPVWKRLEEHYSRKGTALGERMMQAHREKTRLRQSNRMYIHPPAE
jgi:hypothetical protein